MCGRGVPQEAHLEHQAEDQTEVDFGIQMTVRRDIFL